MLKLIALISRKSGLTDEEFYKYWKEKHGPLAAKIIPGLRKYIQNHLVRLPGIKYDGDGFVELWFDNLEAYEKFLTWRQSDGAKVLLDDEDKFMDRSKLVRYVVEEHIIIK
jgi:uncharacterized protein (TIGR02118 family)